MFIAIFRVSYGDKLLFQVETWVILEESRIFQYIRNKQF